MAASNPSRPSTTRSGKKYSSFLDATPFYCSSSFDFNSLLQEATETESALDDFDEHTTTTPFDDCSSAAPFNNRSTTAPSKAPCPTFLPPIPMTSESPRPAYSTYQFKRTSDDPKTLDNARRKRKRANKIAQNGHQPHPSTIKKVIQASTPASVSADFANFPAAAGADQAKISRLKVPRLLAADVPHSAASLSTQGFDCLPWNGITCRPFFDKAGRLIALLGGRPKDAAYLQSTNAVFDLMMQEGLKANFHQKFQEHTRGRFMALNVGVTHGKGTHHPVNLDNHEHTEMVARLLASKHVQRMASFSDGSFALWNTLVYDYYLRYLKTLFEKMPELRRIFDRSVFPTAAFNFGPNVWTYKHRDVLNCPFGWCAIQALGRFDPTKGGHLVLWELGLVIEFPPGSLILIPSATTTHSNTPIAEGDVRASFTQYCPGGLFWPL